MNLPDIGAAEVFPHVGLGAPISTTVYFQFIKDGILSNECKLKIDGEEILTLNYSSARARINQTDNTENSEEMQSVISQQGLQFNLVIPYLRRGKVQEIVEDINLGGLGKTYTLAYDDGIVDKEWQVIIKDGSVSYQAGKVPTITVSFLLAREDIYG